MPVIQGFDSVWSDHPEWLDRYDFAIATPPEETWYQSLHESSAGGRGVRCRGARRRRASAWLPSLSALVLPFSSMSSGHVFDTDRVFFTHFLWRSNADGSKSSQYHCVTRQDLVSAFDYLVNNAEEVFHIHADLGATLIEFERFVDDNGDEPEYQALLARAEAELEAVARIASPISNATEYFGKYLSFFSDLESAKVSPSVWRRCVDLPALDLDGSDPTGTDRHYLGAWRPNVETTELDTRNGTTDSYAFIAAARWVRHERRTMCPATDSTIAAAAAKVEEFRGQMYLVMRRDVPPPWDRSIRRTSVVDLWEQQVRRSSASSAASSADSVSSDSVRSSSGSSSLWSRASASVASDDEGMGVAA